MDFVDPALTSSSACELGTRFWAVRDFTEALVSSLSDEDQCVQSMPDASPAKWHRAHTTWFFEQFVLGTFDPSYQPYDPVFGFLFNSYYEAVGARHPRAKRGLLTRPAANEVGPYRRHVDDAVVRSLPHLPDEALGLIELGLQHEQQHQELLVTDTLHLFSENPLRPAMLPGWRVPPVTAGNTFTNVPAGVASIGHDGAGFCFDNETPRHAVLNAGCRIATGLVRNADWLAFMQDGGYRTVGLWMADGWAVAQDAGWRSPLYWLLQDDAWWEFGPGGLVPLDLDAAVRHVSWYEANAFARWADARLPTEAEWETAATSFVMDDAVGQVWQWTASAYAPYPGYRPAVGAVGEYNGKFMINQMVLRGGSMVTPAGHVRPTYRNFFHPEKRWQFSGVRLARDV